MGESQHYSGPLTDAHVLPSTLVPHCPCRPLLARTALGPERMRTVHRGQEIGWRVVKEPEWRDNQPRAPSDCLIYGKKRKFPDQGYWCLNGERESAGHFRYGLAVRPRSKCAHLSTPPLTLFLMAMMIQDTSNNPSLLQIMQSCIPILLL